MPFSTHDKLGSLLFMRTDQCHTSHPECTTNFAHITHISSILAYRNNCSLALFGSQAHAILMLYLNTSTSQVAQISKCLSPPGCDGGELSNGWRKLDEP